MKNGFLTMAAIGNYGRFMNGGYQIAAVLGIAKKNNLEPCFKPWINADHRDRFGSTEDVDLQKYFVNPLPSIPEGIEWNQEHGVPWGFHDIVLPPGNWNISGHFQSPRYFDNCMDTVQHYFRMKNEPPQNDYCALHVRLTDYDNAYHPRLDRRYYETAMRLFPSDQKFLVFSDDIPAVKVMMNEIFNDTLVVGGHVEYSEGLDYIQDFKRLKRCASFIIGNSSYSAMAAVLGEHPEKRVVAPRPWFGASYAQIDGEDIYDKGWEIINWQ